MYITSNTSESYYQTAYNLNGYGGMAYFSSATCGDAKNTYTGCINDYAQSEVKYVVDGWKNAKAPAATEARLITKEELESEIREYDPCGGCGAVETGEFVKYDWLYNSNYWYWTMSQNETLPSDVWHVYENGRFGGNGIFGIYGMVRPVIVIN